MVRLRTPVAVPHPLSSLDDGLLGIGNDWRKVAIFECLLCDNFTGY